MAMLIFLVTLTVLIASIYAGYRFNMHLYAHGVLGDHSRKMAYEVEESSSTVLSSRDNALPRVRDYGLQYARTGILVFAIMVVGIIVCLMALISAIL